MKKATVQNHLFGIIIFACLLTLPLSLHAQTVTIPDANFRSWLMANGFGSCLNGNQLDINCPEVLNANKINCSSQNISDLSGIEVFTGLDTLICDNNDLTSINSLPPNLLYFYCEGNPNLSSIASFPSSLKVISVQGGQLTSLPPLPASLNVLLVLSNQLTSLPSLPPGLTDLHCGGNSLGAYFAGGTAVLPFGLTYFTCQGNNITDLPPLPASLVDFSCSNNQLTSLDVSSTNIMWLDCSYNQLSSLGTLPASLNSLNCNNNQLSSLGTLPASLYSLNCSNNQLTSLGVLPANLNSLNCSFNQLTSITSLPPGLGIFDCSYNLLTTLSLCNYVGSTNNFNVFDCGFNQLQMIDTVGCSAGFSGSSGIALRLNDNQLTELPDLPSNISYLYINNNTALSCLPEFNVISVLNFSNTGIQCLPTYGSVTNSTPALASLPLCDPFNFNNCSWVYNITGRVYRDSVVNCQYDSGEQDFSNVKIQLYQGAAPFMQTFTGGEGFYSFDAPIGSYTYFVDDTGMPYETECPVGFFHSSSITALDSTDTNMDFGLKCKAGVDLGALNMNNGTLDLRPGKDLTLRPTIGDLSKLYNLNCAAGVGGTVTITFSGPISYSGIVPGALTPILGTNTLEYSIADFGALDLNSAFSFIMTIDTTAQSGQQICFVVDVTPVAGDIDPSNNTFQHCYLVVNSFDPNDKLVNPVGDITAAQQWLNYTVRFQNTGNAPAEHIYILDTLDQNLDELSFQFLGASHTSRVTVTGNVIRFDFPFINLADSNSNEPESHGYVNYRVRLTPSLPVNTTIINSAAIYFDYNPPVITNETVNTIVLPSGIEEAGQSPWLIFPNPGTGIFRMRSPGGLLKIYNAIGELIYEKRVDEQMSQFDISHFANGIYFVVLSTQDSTVQQKIFLNK